VVCKIGKNNSKQHKLKPNKKSALRNHGAYTVKETTFFPKREIERFLPKEKHKQCLYFARRDVVSLLYIKTRSSP